MYLLANLLFNIALCLVHNFELLYLMWNQHFIITKLR
jgi:hypothetical protein